MLESPILTKFAGRKPLDGVLVIDAHVHFGALQFGTPRTDAAGILEEMDRLGIRFSWVSAMRALSQDYELGNNDTIDLCDRFPDRFIGYCVYNPHYEAVMLAELERCLANKAIRGVKIHPTSYGADYPIDGPKYEPLFEYAEQKGLPILTHAGPRSELYRCGPQLIARVLKRHPHLTLIIGHSGSYDLHLKTDALDEHLALAVGNDNVFMDLCAMGRYYGVLEYMVGRMGSERIVAGSDAPFHSFTAEIGHVMYARLSDAEKERILGLNAARLAGLK
ncbi:MAG: amidohydrolase family protein [Chloroflexota bacterium]